MKKICDQLCEDVVNIDDTRQLTFYLFLVSKNNICSFLENVKTFLAAQSTFCSKELLFS